MSHNSRYYVKKLKKAPDGTKSIISFFNKSSSAILDSSINSGLEPASTSSESENLIDNDNPTHSPISETDPDSTVDNAVSMECVDKPESESVDNPATGSLDKPVCDRIDRDGLSVPTVQMKFVSPSSPPNKKSRTSEHDSRLFHSARYEARFSWVYYNQTKRGYMCKLCELFSLCDDKSTPYVSCGAILGTHLSRRLEIHENSDRHKTSASMYSKCSTKTIPELLSQKSKSSDKEMVERNRRYIKKLFQSCLFLCEKNWAQSNMEDLVKFMGRTCDADIKSVLAEDSITYLSSTSVSDIIKVLSNFFEQKTLTQLREEKFTLLADESTDQSNRTQLSVFARWITPQGPREDYLGLIHVERTTSEALMEAIERFLMGKMIPFQNVRFVGLDGCNTMSGCNKGLQRRIRNVSPLCIYINCRNHRLALCFVHLLKKNSILTDVDTLLLAIWKTFHFSPKKAAVFESFQEVYGQRPINMVKAATTRWLSHLHACVRFTARYETLLDTMDSLIDSTHEPEMHGIRSSMTRKQTVAMILVLTDVLKPINYLSLYLQEDCGVFSELPTRVKQCRDDLEAIIQQYRQGNYEGLEFSKCEDLFFIIDDRAALARRNRAHAAEVTPAGFLEVHGIPLIYNLITEVEDAFTSHDAVLDAFSVLHPSNLPQDIADITDYGQDKARVLSDYYGSEKVDVFEGHRTVAPPELGSSAVIYSQILDFLST